MATFEFQKTHLNNSASSMLVTKSWKATWRQEVPSVKSCSHLSAFAMQLVASVCTSTNKTVQALWMVQMLGSSLILVVGENNFTIATIFELTDVGGVSFTSCSMMSSHIWRSHDDVPPRPSLVFEISFTGIASSATERWWVVSWSKLSRSENAVQ